MIATDYQQRANQHRPTTSADIERECLRLFLTGLKPRDISTALRLDVAVVLDALRAAPSTPAAPSGFAPQFSRSPAVGDALSSTPSPGVSPWV